MWYPPFNTGAGYAMGIRAGAEMTSFEMRFVAQRCKDTIAPTGTIALGVGAREINARGEIFEEKYGLSTSGRAHGVTGENRLGRGPCFLRTKGISGQQEQGLLRAYLNMAPAQTLHWIESGRMPSVSNVEIEGTEPYIVGGHTGSGFWVDRGRRTTIRGLYAAGDAAGGAPKKFVPGALAEGGIAALTMLDDLPDLQQVRWDSVDGQVQSFFADYESRIRPGSAGRGSGNDVFGLEEAMQKVMDEYAGGIRTGYRYSAARLELAQERILELRGLAETLTVSSAEDLYRIYELLDRLDVCRTLIAHMQARRETRWPGFGIHTDHPDRDDRFALFINSVVRDGEIRMVFRPLQKRGEK
jgi:adenylylsulfate reductase subunit A